MPRQAVRDSYRGRRAARGAIQPKLCRVAHGSGAETLPILRRTLPEGCENLNAAWWTDTVSFV